MNLTLAINRNSAYFFVFVLLASFLAFWQPYISQITAEPDALVHIHGFLMTVWILMLISQACLIRTNYRTLHKQIGKASYFIAPFVLVSIATIRHNALSRIPDPINADLTLLFPNAVIQPLIFALAYTLAIVYRRDAAIHARLMICTTIPMAGPVFNRIIGTYLSPELNGLMITNATVLLLLTVLSVIDWRSARRIYVFPFMLSVLVVLRMIGQVLLAQTETMKAFVGWYMSLPLS